MTHDNKRYVQLVNESFGQTWADNPNAQWMRRQALELAERAFRVGYEEAVKNYAVEGRT